MTGDTVSPFNRSHERIAPLLGLGAGVDAERPLPALRQLVRNAVMHRSYEGTNSPTHVYWYDDRIEINSPGGPYGEVTAENFGQAGFVAYRNPLLAEAMRVLNLVQQWGAGLPIARRELRANGQQDPQFKITPHRIFCTVEARSDRGPQQ